MPPEITPIPRPTRGGKDAVDYLATYGIQAIEPPVRSSDYNLVLANPLLYLVIRRFGLVKGLSYSEAKNRGSWYHLLQQFPDDALAHAENRYGQRLVELNTACKMYGIEGETRTNILRREKEDFYFAKALYEAANQVSMGAAYGTMSKYFGQPHWTLLGTEYNLDWEYEGIKCKAVLDRLYYHENQATLWIPDYKTTTFEAKLRALSCPIEFQTWHYLNGVRRLLPEIIKRHSLSLNTRVGGMMHIIVQKPNIKFGSKDCPVLRWQSEGKRSGISGRVVPTNNGYTLTLSTEGIASNYPNTPEGLEEALQTLAEATGKKPEAVRSEEPSYPHFLRRVSDCMLARGEYASDRAEREANPYVLGSFTTATEVFSEYQNAQYERRLRFIHSHATRPPYPEDFLSAPDSVLAFGKKSDYASFLLTPPANWPEVVTLERFVSIHRDNPTESEDE